MPNSEAFNQAVTRSRELTQRPTNEELLKLYALFKQATEGDVSGSRPTGFDLKGMAKYDSWAKLKGMTAEEAEAAYIGLVDSLHERQRA